jgi:hypothetical protein
MICRSEFCVCECLMYRLNLMSDLKNHFVHCELFIVDRVNTLLHDELIKKAACSDQSVLVYQNAYCFITGDNHYIYDLIHLFIILYTILFNNIAANPSI